MIIQGSIKREREAAEQEMLNYLEAKENYIKQILWERDTAIQQLEEIGASLGGKMDFIKSAIEKQKAKKPIHAGLYACPNCHTILLQGAFEARGKCCKEYEQKLDWSDDD